ncbi:MAG TPA: hypothetical protein VK253_06215, partial [Candidatus Binatia bacterium]|nr:hypothetical protein [Candidatus Binatia bacterium]
VPDLLSAYNSGLFESAPNPMSMNSQFRAVIEFGEQELTILKNFLRKKHITNFDLRGKNPSLGLGISPRMAVKDEDEVMLFVTQRNATKAEQDDVCLWTNCRTLVLSFSSVFRDIWRNAPNIEEKVTEMKASQVVPRAFDIGNTENARLTYDKTVQSAEKEVLIVTSADGLAALAKRFSFFKELASKGVQVKILAPITPENYVITQELLEICDVRNFAADYAETTLVDGQHLFQFDYQPVDHHYEDLSHFENMTYIIDFEYLKKTKVAFTDLWTNALLPSSNLTKKPINAAPKQVVTPPEEKRWSEYSKVMNQAEGQIGGLTEKDVLDKIIKAKRKPAKTWSDPILFYGSHASAVIHPPYYFNLPNMMLSIYHNNKQSSFGDEDLMIISLWLETPKGHAYVPVALVTDNPEGSILRKKVWERTPVANNYQIVKKDEFEVRVQSNTLFAGWTAPILLVPSKYMLPPACILFEGYGKLVSGVSKTVVPSGRKVTTEYNGLEAFVTFFHPSSKYSGPGTDGLFARDAITSSVP